MRNLNDIFILDELNHNSGHLDIAVENLIDGNPSSVYYHLINLLYDEISGIDNDTKTPISLFKFTGLPVLNEGEKDETKPVIDNIVNEALSFAKPKIFNDPMDPILREWLNMKEKVAVTKLDKRIFNYLKRSLENLRICCLSKSDGSIHLNPLMWAHYADKHKGICIEYEITRKMLDNYNNDNQVLKICDVRYRRSKIMSDYITIDNALLAKGDAWKYEKETRLLYYEKCSVAKTRKLGDYLSLDGFKIKSIYLGYRMSDKDKHDVIEACRRKHVDFYQVRFHHSDITRLAVDKIHQ